MTNGSVLRAGVVGLGMMGRNHVRVLGDMPGVELYDHVAERWPALAERFVFMSGGDVAGRASSLAATGVPCLEKPFHPERIDELLARRDGTRSPAAK